MQRLQQELTSPLDAHEDMARQELQRLLDEHIVLYNAPSDQIRCLAMLCKIATNVLSEPENLKYRRVKAKNEALSERVLSVRGGRAFLVAMGFVPTVIEFEEHFQLPGLEVDIHGRIQPCYPVCRRSMELCGADANPALLSTGRRRAGHGWRRGA